MGGGRSRGAAGVTLRLRAVNLGRARAEQVVASMLGFLDAVVPCGCAICRIAVPAHGPPVCELCASRVPPVPPPLCPRCGLTRVIPGPGQQDCSDCHTWSPSLHKAASACLHTGPAAELVRGLKYRGWTGLADYMGGLMLPSAERLAGESAPLLVPVPLTTARRRERGFNQAELLAVALSCRTGWTISRLLRKNRGGPALARLDRRRREQAAKGAYSIEAGALGEYSPQPAVLIVDDVITTGATGTACAEVLEAAGSQCLGIVSFARTNPLAERT